MLIVCFDLVQLQHPPKYPLKAATLIPLASVVAIVVAVAFVALFVYF